MVTEIIQWNVKLAVKTQQLSFQKS